MISMFGAWSLASIWALIISSSSIATIIGVVAVAVAILLPKQLDFITGLRKWAIVVAVIAFGYSAVFTKGMDYGLSVKQGQWDSAVVKESENGESARSDAVSTVRALPPASVRDDGWNRDNWK